jgi:hypothetical protein
MLLFALFFLPLQFSDQIAGLGDSIFFQDPQYLVYPLQTLACAAAIIYFWPAWKLRLPSLRAWGWAVLLAILIFFIWVSPQMFFGAPPRTEGFDPTVFEENPWLYWTNLIFRFLRLVVIVPIVEEVFWRGFLQRFLIEQDVDEVPLGRFTWFSFLGVAFFFGLAHLPDDFWVAVITGLLWNWLIVHTKSLSACIISHALINAALGIWILQTGQYGFW